MKDKFVLCFVLAVLAYIPALNNGFIADDYVILKRVEILKTHPLYLYQVPPENFRAVSYVVFGVIKYFAGYHAGPFYVFNIGLHLANIFLLYLFLSDLIGKPAARLAALLFSVFQAPQEAVMWLAAMNETTLFFFAMLTLICWRRNRHYAAAAAYTLALFSKESAIVIPLALLLIDFWKEKQLFWKRYVLPAVVTAVFGGIFLFTASRNFMLTSRSYTFGPHALLVVAASLHRLAWPWLYIVAGVVWLTCRELPWRRIGAYLGLVVLTMVPYMFIAYQANLPSRQVYLASAVMMTLFASLLQPVRGTFLAKSLIAIFVAFNVGYIWFRKDAQFEERAAPTTQLTAAFRAHAPQRTQIRNFAYPYPEIASSAALAATGWSPSLIVTDSGTPCSDCLQLEWDSRARRYRAEEARQ